jgi:hypothetical protein
MIGKLHIQENKKIFACCDKELLDTKLRFNDIDIIIHSSFFGKENLTKEQVLENIEECDCANIFGNNVCDLLLKNNLITKEQIIYIDKISHAQIYKL